ncbi:MAG: glycosyltransferase [Planctomycetota bacterium]
MAQSVPHLLHVFTTFCAAGSQVRTTQLMNRFGARYRHTVIARDGRTEATALLAEDVPCEVMELPRLEGPLAGVRAMREALEAARPDLLMTYNWGTMDAVLAARSVRLARHVHHEDGFNADEAARLKGRRNFTRRVTLRRTDVIVPSRTLERIARRRWRLPRVHFIANGVAIERFGYDQARGAAFRAELGIPAEALVVGSVGHLRGVKCFPRLVRAAAAIDPAGLGGRPVHLVIVGEGEERGAIEAAAARSRPPGGAVHLPGHKQDLAGAYSAFDVFTLTSDSEQQPVSLLEAMAAGRPVVATDVGDIAATLPAAGRDGIVPLGTGAAVEEALGRALTRLLADPDLRARMGAAGRAHVAQEYDPDRMAVAHEAIWRGALAR